MADGRTVWIDCADVPRGFPVLVHAGSPGSRRLFAPAAEQAAEHGLRLISYDRPGFGETPAKPGRSICDGAAETQAIAEALGISRLAVWGLSGGGPYALACAALLPELVVACCVLASLAPFGAPGLDFSAGWSAAHGREVELFFEQPEVAREHFRTEAAELYPLLSTAEGWLGQWRDRAETDEAHSREMAEYLALVFQDCLGHGDQGWWDDWGAFLTPWGFDLAAIRVPVQLWHGELDTSVSPAHGHWLAAHIPGVDAHFPASDDHTNIEAHHRSEAYNWLRQHA